MRSSTLRTSNKKARIRIYEENAEELYEDRYGQVRWSGGKVRETY
jgi:hypothetical protein